MCPSDATVTEGGDRLQVAVVGAGPSGLYAVRALLESAVEVSVDVFDRLPAPYGLVRYGVAPDNQKMKSVIRVLHGSFDEDNDVRFLGNVTFGTDITRADLRAHYDAVIYATGTQGDRKLGVAGEDLPGSSGAREFVSWYCGHPDAAGHDFPLRCRHAAVVGAGNVALDVTRMLAKSPEEIAGTDVPDRVLETFRDNRITDIHLLSRRGPAQAKFTPIELREMGELVNADIVIDPGELVLTEDDEQRVAADRQLRKNVALLREWAERPLEGKPRRVHMRFLRSPVRLLGENEVEGVVIERNELLDDGKVRGTGEYETLDAGLVFAAVGYQALPLPDVPFDHDTATVPHDAGRVLGSDGTQEPGEYVTGWAKRGPSGVIGTNKNDAAETVNSLLADLADRASTRSYDRTGITRLLERRGVDYVDWAGWLRVDTHETQLGEAQNRPRVKVPDQPSLLELARRPAR
ncbi:FAD-dependent oxidoreductase [Haloechinothrix sp. YIM 98757]|uniref:ferredoxin--NADP(+) reductase n=1 Tax=Haloechinothrix aidingensis TaxID=2752311 RepID=A0A838A6I2_9PSEU|nr:FAD-dependent oxidoreductase [Haloechinothrix aidingensis]MBA0124505.1 FAD-dependent oxidoreductase [Haloechinothrix aidingensis]